MTAKDLKNALLQEAVQGKLVPQIASEGNARDLLEEIRKERLSHGLDFANAKSGKKSKKETALAGSNPCDIPEEEIPFDIPESWCWVRWGELSDSIQYGYNASAQEKGKIRMVRISDIQENKVLWDTVPFCEIKDEEIPTYLLKENDILFARTGGTVGKSFLVKNIPCNAIYAGYLIRTHYNSEKLAPEYLKFFMESELYWSQLRNGTIATAQPNCNGQTLSKMLIPLPPLAEQKRIVAAIEKFMPLIEEYGKKETVLNELNAQIGTLTKKAILQEAVQGKLVPQIPAEGNAKDLLEQIKAQKAALIKEGKIKKEKPLPEITEDEIPFDIPENWCWCRFEEVMYLLSSKNYQIKQSDILTEGKYPVISQSQNKIEGYYDDSSKILKNPGIVLVFGDHSRTIKFIDFDFIVGADGTQLIVPIGIGSKYFYYFIKYVIINLPERNYGRHFSLLKSHVVPLPPLSEQKRIVAAIEQLLPLCEKLGR